MIWPEIGAAMPSRLRPPPPTPAADTMLCACVSAIRASVAAVRAAIRSCSGDTFWAKSRCSRASSGFSPRRYRSEEHTSELQSLMRISYAVFCLKKKQQITKKNQNTTETIIYTNKQQRETQVTHKYTNRQK